MVGIFDAEQALAIEAPGSSKRGRKKSPVWEHFTVESVAGGSTTRARCNLCYQTFAYSSGSKIAGTSHLKRHITMGSCPKIRDQRSISLALTPASDAPPTKRRPRSSGGVAAVFDQEHSCEDLAKMIAMEDYPLHIVEHPAFTTFVHGLQPRFRVPSFSAIEAQITAIYQREKQSLRRLLAGVPGRVSLTVGLWTTAQTLGYVCLAGHFVGGDWKLRRRTLSFTMVSSPHSETALAEVIGFVLSDWDLQAKLFTVTLDNSHCSSHDIYSAALRRHLAGKSSALLNGRIFAVRCYAHILTVIAQDLLASIHGVVYSVRESIKYLKASPERETRFAEIARRLEIADGGAAATGLCLDAQARWDSTYFMLAGAAELRHAFAFMESSDPDYNDAPSPEDWKKAEAVCGYLKLCYESAMAVAAAAEPTANLFFQEAWKMQLELTRAAKEDPAAREMQEKFDKYWKDCSLVMAVAVVMDPRFKMKLVHFSFAKIYAAAAADKYVKMVDDAVRGLFADYLAGDEGAAPPLTDFDVYMSAAGLTERSKSELDQYLEEALVPRGQELEVLEWWKVNELKYPILAKMARDVLAVPMSTVPMGSIFGGAAGSSRMLDDYRSSLRPETLEALVCARDWLPPLPTIPEPPPPPPPPPPSAVVKPEF